MDNGKMYDRSSRLFQEGLIPLQEAASIVPGGTIHKLRRWADVGFHGVQLETMLVGRIRFTTRGAVSRFLVRINDVNQPGLCPPEEQAPDAEELAEWKEAEAAEKSV
jgi:hypothetical protein